MCEAEAARLDRSRHLRGKIAQASIPPSSTGSSFARQGGFRYTDMRCKSSNDWNRAIEHRPVRSRVCAHATGLDGSSSRRAHAPGQGATRDQDRRAEEGESTKPTSADESDARRHTYRPCHERCGDDRAKKTRAEKTMRRTASNSRGLRHPPRSANRLWAGGPDAGLRAVRAAVFPYSWAAGNRPEHRFCPRIRERNIAGVGGDVMISALDAPRACATHRRRPRQALRTTSQRRAAGDSDRTQEPFAIIRLSDSPSGRVVVEQGLRILVIRARNIVAPSRRTASRGGASDADGRRARPRVRRITQRSRAERSTSSKSRNLRSMSIA